MKDTVDKLVRSTRTSPIYAKFLNELDTFCSILNPTDSDFHTLLKYRSNHQSYCELLLIVRYAPIVVV
jgi:hypothetical protein